MGRNQHTVLRKKKKKSHLVNAISKFRSTVSHKFRRQLKRRITDFDVIEIIDLAFEEDSQRQKNQDKVLINEIEEDQVSQLENQQHRNNQDEHTPETFESIREPIQVNHSSFFQQWLSFLKVTTNLNYSSFQKENSETWDINEEKRINYLNSHEKLEKENPETFKAMSTPKFGNSMQDDCSDDNSSTHIFRSAISKEVSANQELISGFLEKKAPDSDIFSFKDCSSKYIVEPEIEGPQSVGFMDLNDKEMSSASMTHTPPDWFTLNNCFLNESPKKLESKGFNIPKPDDIRHESLKLEEWNSSEKDICLKLEDSMGGGDEPLYFLFNEVKGLNPESVQSFFNEAFGLVDF